MIVYYFTSEKYGIENLKQKRLKISSFLSVNDPFELLGIELRDKDIREAVECKKSEITQTKGLLCFSEDKYNPVQWAHYADNHKGLCLGFEISEEILKPVDYVPERLEKKTLDQPDCNEKLLTTKFKHWDYEQELRLIIKHSGHPKNGDGYRFKKFGNDMVLKEIYIGCKSKLKFEDIISSYKSDDKDKNNVIVKITRPSFRDFRIVWDQSKKSKRI